MGISVTIIFDKWHQFRALDKALQISRIGYAIPDENVCSRQEMKVVPHSFLVCTG